MADITRRVPDCDDCDGERGERGERGKRGHRGPEGPQGPAGPGGPATTLVGPTEGDGVIIAAENIPVGSVIAAGGSAVLALAANAVNINQTGRIPLGISLGELVQLCLQQHPDWTPEECAASAKDVCIFDPVSNECLLLVSGSIHVGTRANAVGTACGLRAGSVIDARSFRRLAGVMRKLRGYLGNLGFLGTLGTL
jgi:hypothetical protein